MFLINSELLFLVGSKLLFLVGGELLFLVGSLQGSMSLPGTLVRESGTYGAAGVCARATVIDILSCRLPAIYSKRRDK